MSSTSTDISQDRVCAAVLAGGRASRYGGLPKGLLEIQPGFSILDRLLQQITNTGIDEIVISANQPEPYLRFNRPVISDNVPDSGPIGGIEAVLVHYSQVCDRVLFVPCDLPGMTAEVLRELLIAARSREARVVYARTGAFFEHPLCAVVHNDTLESIRAAIHQGQRRILDIWHQLGAQPVDFEADRPFFNVNTPEDLAGWHEMKERQK